MLRRAASCVVSFAAVIILTFLCACNDTAPVAVKQLKVFSGDEQCAAAGEEYSADLMVHAYGREKNAENGKMVAVPGTKLVFRAEKGSDLQIIPSEVMTRKDGLAVVKVKAGKKTGDQYLKVFPEGDESKAIRLRFISGVKLLGTDADREGQSGKTLDKAVGICVTNADGTPRAGVPVYFAASGVKLANSEVLTDEKGEAKTLVTLGKKTGKY